MEGYTSCNRLGRQKSKVTFGEPLFSKVVGAGAGTIRCRNVSIKINFANLIRKV